MARKPEIAAAALRSKKDVRKLCQFINGLSVDMANLHEAPGTEKLAEMSPQDRLALQRVSQVGSKVLDELHLQLSLCDSVTSEQLQKMMSVAFTFTLGRHYEATRDKPGEQERDRALIMASGVRESAEAWCRRNAKSAADPEGKTFIFAGAVGMLMQGSAFPSVLSAFAELAHAAPASGPAAKKHARATRSPVLTKKEDILELAHYIRSLEHMRFSISDNNGPRTPSRHDQACIELIVPMVQRILGNVCASVENADRLTKKALQEVVNRELKSECVAYVESTPQHLIDLHDRIVKLSALQAPPDEKRPKNIGRFPEVIEVVAMLVGALRDNICEYLETLAQQQEHRRG